MSTKSTIGNHKDFDAKVKNTVGTFIYNKLTSLGVGIKHIKKICLKIGKQKEEIFKAHFLDKCGALIQKLEELVAAGQSYKEKLVASSKSYNKTSIKKIISDLFLIKASI